MCTYGRATVNAMTAVVNVRASNSDQDDGCKFDRCARSSDLAGHTSRDLAEHGTAPDRPRRGTSRNLAHASEKVSDNKWHVDAESLGLHPVGDLSAAKPGRRGCSACRLATDASCMRGPARTRWSLCGD